MLKKIAALLSAAALLALPALAEDADLTYSGTLDPVTGLPITAQSSASAAEENPTRIRLAAGEEYDTELERYIFTLPNGAEVTANVADGFVTTDSVTISAPSNAAVVLYRNGQEVQTDSSGTVEEAGSYVLLSQTSGLPEQIFTFTITDAFTSLKEYRLPRGFAVTGVTLDDVEQSITASTVDLSREGRYRIAYGCLNTDRTYVLDVSVDHTAPVLKLEGVENGLARGAVDISDLEPNVKLYCLLDGKSISPNDVLNKSGDYSLRLEDPAGNVTEYYFTIGVYLNLSAWFFVAVSLALVAGIALYLFASRKKLRIR